MSEITGKLIEQLITTYCTNHSSRRINFLYWNTIDHADHKLHMVNLTGKELIQTNNAKLVYRLVDVKDQIDYQYLQDFFTQYIVDSSDPNAAYVIRLDYLIKYLNTIDHDLSKFKLDRNDFGTLSFNVSTIVEGKPAIQVKVVSVVDTDIQSLYLIDQLYTKYQTFFQNTDDTTVIDIRDQYISEEQFKLYIEELSVSIAVIEGLDIVSRKYARQCKQSDPAYTLEELYRQNGMSTIVNRSRSKTMDIVSVRVYVQLFLKNYCSRTRKK